ncbi:alpha/beta fold hydrolase [Nostoc sp.]|uniref:alpha/beta fold hydrolase n=1 Tax=Nostoc sp. TaxID=1180 RepID=UPI002FF870BD
MKLKTRGLSFNVMETGAGEPALLFLHYWGGSARTWNVVMSSLSADFRCIAYDQRGWGGSDAPLQGYSIRDLAVDTKEVLQALEIQRYVLVGHSMGGKVAQFLAALRPIGLEKLVLVAPATPTPQNIPEFARQAQLHAYDNRENALKALEFLTAQPQSNELREQIIADNLAAAPHAKLAWPTLSAYEDISAEVNNIAVPTLIVAGDQDRQDPVEQHKREVLSRIPGAKMQIIQDCGHLIPVDQPERLAEAIRNFVLNQDLRNCHK